MFKNISNLNPINQVKKYPFWSYIRRYPRRYAIGLLTLAAVDLVNVTLPILVKYGIDAIPAKNTKQLMWASLAYLFLMVIQSYGRYLWRIYLMGTSHLVVKELRERVYTHLQRLPLEFHQRISSGDLMSRVTNDIESIRMALGPGILVTADAVLMLILIIPPMLFLSVKLSLLAFAFYPVVPWITKKIGSRIDEIFERLQQKMAGISSFAQESFAGVRLIRALVLEPEISKRFRGLSQDYREQGISLAKWEAVFSPSLGLLTNLGTFLILLLGGMDVIHGAITVGTFVAFQRFVVQLSWPMEAIGWAVTMHREGFAAQRRIGEVLQEPELRSVIIQDRTTKTDELRLLQVKNLKFHYKDWDSKKSFVLSLDHLHVEKGKKIGLVGKVGSGKTTFLNLLLRMYVLQPESVYFMGHDILSIPISELRKNIAMVEQNIFLFSESVVENVSLGLKVIEEEKVLLALDTAQIKDEVSRLPLGIKTTLGEKGVTLSGGQKQRLAVARALLREPKLLLLDDCFSAVDVEIEKRIIDSFFSRHSSLTVLFSSHRLSVMPRMDEVWVFDQGNIVEKGTHEHLIQFSPLYQQLWNKSERESEKEKLGLIEGEIQL